MEFMYICMYVCHFAGFGHLTGSIFEIPYNCKNLLSESFPHPLTMESLLAKLSFACERLGRRMDSIMPVIRNNLN